MNLSEAHRNPIRNRDMSTKMDMMVNFKRRQFASEVLYMTTKLIVVK
jgi:hypothetical protein